MQTNLLGRKCKIAEATGEIVAVYQSQHAHLHVVVLTPKGILIFAFLGDITVDAELPGDSLALLEAAYSCDISC